MVKKSNSEGIVSMGEGLQRQTLVRGERTHLVKFMLGKGSIVPLHNHPHEQTGHLLSGSMRLTIDGKKYDRLSAGVLEATFPTKQWYWKILS